MLSFSTLKWLLNAQKQQTWVISNTNQLLLSCSDQEGWNNLQSLSIIVMYDTLLFVHTTLLVLAAIVMDNVSLFSTLRSSTIVMLSHTLAPITAPEENVSVAGVEV